jgi:hypothetical protein
MDPDWEAYCDEKPMGISKTNPADIISTVTWRGMNTPQFLSLPRFLPQSN